MISDVMRSDTPVMESIEINLSGRLQGVGLRPFLWRLAQRLDIRGSTCNTPTGVRIIAQGSRESIQDFQEHLISNPPEFAEIESFRSRELTIENFERFEIHDSQVDPLAPNTFPWCSIPDLPPCRACIEEMRQPGTRRYLDPMISCTQCGPRYSIQLAAPFDRCRTTMEPYDLCDRCLEEYANPYDRRFHSQTISCYICGPTWNWINCKRSNETIEGDSSQSMRVVLERCAQSILSGDVVLWKSTGGYQFVCDATNSLAVEKLREIKQRSSKPFALLVSSVVAASSIVALSSTALRLLTSSERPIVVSPRLTNSIQSAGISDEVNRVDARLGLMIPNSAMQILLLDQLEQMGQTIPLVVTSANGSNAPMLTDDRVAIDRFGQFVGGVLTHPRAITQPLDDSVWIDGGWCDTRIESQGSSDALAIPVRRARGASPMQLRLNTPKGNSCKESIQRSTVALGGDLKTTIAVRLAGDLQGGDWQGGDLKETGVSFQRVESSTLPILWTQHFGDASDLDVFERMRQTALRECGRIVNKSLLELRVDAHPNYHTYQLGLDLCAESSSQASSPVLMRIQHHAAHLGALACDLAWDQDKPLLGFVFDGTGYGTDGTIWGGELLRLEPNAIRQTEARRIGHLRQVRLPAGDVAARYPWRCAMAYLSEIGEAPSRWLEPFRSLGESERRLIAANDIVASGTIPSSSIGRLIDAVASLLGLVHENDYEGHAAMRLEAVAWEHIQSLTANQKNAYAFNDSYRFQLQWIDGVLVFDERPVLIDLLKDLTQVGVSDQVILPMIACRFHGALVKLICDAVIQCDTVIQCDAGIPSDTGIPSDRGTRCDTATSRDKGLSVGITGGVFQNSLLLKAIGEHLNAMGYKLLSHKQIPPNDAGISVGQLWFS